MTDPISASTLRFDDPAIVRWLSTADELPAGDYVSPGLKIVMPDQAFPEMTLGNEADQPWPYLRRDITHNWYVDRRNPSVGFLDRDEAAILFNSAAMFRGLPSLEVGCWRGWSSAHIALGSGNLEIIDPVLRDSVFADDVRASLMRTGVGDRVVFHPENSPEAIRRIATTENKRWSFIFIDGDHEGDAPLRDAEAARQMATHTAMIMFHDLASPHVANGLLHLREAGWKTRIYHTKQIMGVAWRGPIEPVSHTRNPEQNWTLPDHLQAWPADSASSTCVAVSLPHPHRRTSMQGRSELNAIIELTQLSRVMREERDDYAAKLSEAEAEREVATAAARREAEQSAKELEAAKANHQAEIAHRIQAEAHAQALEKRVSDLNIDLRKHNETGARVADLARELEKASQRTAELEQSYGALQCRLANVEQERNAAAQRALASKLRAELAEESLTSFQDQIDSNRSVVQAAEAKIETIWREREWFEDELVRGRRAAEEHKEAIQREYEQQLERLRHELGKERHQLQEVRRTLHAVWSSRTWRMGAPLRFVLVQLGRR